jgi:Flp pilus assembly protein TadG
MNLRSSVANLRSRLQACALDERGVSAVEFAIILPLMVTLYLGGVEVSQAIAIDRKTTLVARTIADLSSQTTSINNDDMSKLLDAAGQVLTPYPVDKLKVTVSCVKIDADGKATIEWSDTKNGTARAKDSVVTLPSDALAVKNTYLIWAETSYSYKPTIGYVITGTLTLKDQIFMRPRLSDSVKRTTS